MYRECVGVVIAVSCDHSPPAACVHGGHAGIWLVLRAGYRRARPGDSWRARARTTSPEPPAEALPKGEAPRRRATVYNGRSVQAWPLRTTGSPQSENGLGANGFHGLELGFLC